MSFKCNRNSGRLRTRIVEINKIVIITAVILIQINPVIFWFMLLIYPYISKSITEFWRRWHISLGTWFREYVYIPLGGNRKGLIRQIFNLLIVWFCTGFWHGASWNFLIWGGYYGVLLIIEKLFLLKVLKKIPAFFSHVYTLFFVVIGWVIFGFDDMTKGWEYLKGMFGFGRALVLLNKE